MRRYLIRYGIVAVLFLALDATWLSQTHDILYRNNLPGILLDGFRPIPAALFYLLYLFGIVFLAVGPADQTGRVGTAATHGAVLGLVAYGTYDLTNEATLTVWSSVVTAADMAWGMVATTVAASLCFLLTRRWFRIGGN